LSVSEPRFNLIVSAYALREEAAIEELVQYVGGVYVVWKQRSLILVRTTRLNPYAAIEIIRKEIDPRHTNILRVIPVDVVYSPYLEDVAKFVWELAKEKIAENETFRITLEGHLLKLTEEGKAIEARTRESIDYIAKNIDRKVNLTNPDKIVYIKVVKVAGKPYSAITVCKPSYILSTQKMLAERKS